MINLWDWRRIAQVFYERVSKANRVPLPKPWYGRSTADARVMRKETPKKRDGERYRRERACLKRLRRQQRHAGAGARQGRFSYLQSRIPVIQGDLPMTDNEKRPEADALALQIYAWVSVQLMINSPKTRVNYYADHLELVARDAIAAAAIFRAVWDDVSTEQTGKESL
jgi:hypothetical protein